MSSWLEKVKAMPLRWQFAALLVATQITAQAVTMSFTDSLSGMFGLGRESFAADALAPFTTTIAIAERLQSAERDAVIDAAIKSDSRLSLRRNVPATDVQTDIYSKAVLRRVQGRLSNDINRTIVILPRSVEGVLPAPFLVDAAYNIDGQKWLVFSAGSGSSLLSIPIMVGALTIALIATPLAFIAIWIGSALVSPMTALANGAERFSRNLSGSDIPETGPKEVRALAGSFNAMRTRIRKLVDDRSRMLAAVSHDMRTPLTRLRLRIESVDDVEAREAMIDEVKRIDAMINSALTFLRTQKETVKLARIDVAVLARTISDEHVDLG
ncbi:MAG: histidine kinase dimerization/phospho-acceptor domain-containing protein, partial [Notoacmeibacter sp.]